MKESSRRNSNIVSNIAIGAIFVCWTIVILPCTLCIAALHAVFPRSMCAANRRYIWFYGRSMLFLLRPWLPVHMRKPRIAVEYPASIVVCNHQSFLDIYLLGAQDQANVCLATKSWPFRLLFFFAPTMRSAEYIDAESLTTEQVEDQCLDRLRSGATLVVFPEGSRTRTGALGKFRAGAFHIAVRAGRPVLPLLIHNSFQVFPPGSKGFNPATIHMEFLDPVWPQDFAEELLPHRAMMRHVRNLYVKHLTCATGE